MQSKLNNKQIAAFYHDEFVLQQAKHFKKITISKLNPKKVVVDIGGGCGYFANAIAKELDIPVRVIDMDPASVDAAKALGIEAIIDDALKPVKFGDEGIVCFNLILHHLVGRSEKKTFELQKEAISLWHNDGVNIFVNEYIYESWFGGFSGWLIYQVTNSRVLSFFASSIAKVVPSLHANTFGVGVRFRNGEECNRLFSSAGFNLVNEIKGDNEFISFPRRLLLIKSIRRDSFLLAPK